jgi:hypothetical protein
MTAKRGVLLGASISGHNWDTELIGKSEELDFTEVGHSSILDTCSLIQTHRIHLFLHAVSAYPSL